MRKKKGYRYQKNIGDVDLIVVEFIQESQKILLEYSE